MPVDIDGQTGEARIAIGSADWQGAQDVLIVAANDATSGSTLPFTYRVQYSQSTIMWVPRADTTCSENELLVFTVSTANQSGGEVEYAAPVLPSGASFDPVTATFTWRPERSQIGDTLAVFSASGVLDTVRITVTRAPVILSVPADTTVQPGQQFSFPVRVSSVTFQDSVNSFNFGVRVPLDVITVGSVVKGPILPSGAGFNWAVRDDLIVVGGYWGAPLPTGGELFSLLCTVKPEARDTVRQVTLERLFQAGLWLSYLNEKEEPPCIAQSGLLRVQIPNSPPVWMPTPDVTADECVLLTLAFSATDPEGGAIVYSATGLPDGATFDAATGLFTWTPIHGQPGAYAVTFTASDGINLVDQVLVITVNDTPPALALPVAGGVRGAVVEAGVTGTMTGAKGVNLTFLVSRQVVDTVTVVSSPFFEYQWHMIGDTVFVGLADGDGVTLADGEVVRLAFTITENAPVPVISGLVFLPWPLTEVDEQAATLTGGTLEVLNRAPVWTPIADQQAGALAPLQFVVEAVDPDGHGLTYGMPIAPQNATFATDPRTFTMHATFEQAGDTVVVFGVSDGYDVVTDTVAISVWDFYGDVTLDSTVSTQDASQVLKYSVRLEPNDVTTKGTFEVGDVTDNGRVTAFDAGMILYKWLHYDFIFPARMPDAPGKAALPAHAQATSPRSLAFVPAEGGWDLVASDPDGIIGCDLTLLLPDGSQAAFSGEGAIEHALNGQTALVGIARSEFTNPVLLHVSGTAGAPQIVAASLNEGAIPTLLPQPVAFTLSQNTPNPFNPSTTLRFGLPEAGNVALAVYDINGRLVRVLVAGHSEAGQHEIAWDGRDNNGREVASGVYLARLTAPQGVLTRRMVLLR